MHWWCQLCDSWVTVMIDGHHKHESHKDKIVGIRDDIFIDGIKRLVQELKTTNRFSLWVEVHKKPE